MTLNKIKQKQIAAEAKISPGYMSKIWNKKQTAPWATAKRLGAATGTDPIWWVEGQIEKIEQALGMAA